ncbi:follicle cell protein 3C-1 isoform X2 [Harmonia axyridis]|uniref:follicle cell protein 3C-1 isoform X2 n=1 Tax=Harmonia axyridis TaxID=115357 RepID=UPI001E275805|nr:follicle cell protein 3C-1 isoform X2 [Harmonia axyridis]
MAGRFFIASTLALCLVAGIQAGDKGNNLIKTLDKPVPCTCGVFLSGQLKKGTKQDPKGVPVLTEEMDRAFENNPVGVRKCTNKCLETIVAHLPKSASIICASTDRELVHKERAYLFIKNHSDKWQGTNLSAGREFCCKDNEPYKCPVS